jgi:hypothetical protein
VTSARLRAILFLCVAAIAIAVMALGASRRSTLAAPEQPEADRKTLLLLTSLPLLFNEDFSLKESGSPVLRALQARYRVVPISVADGPELAKGRLLLMAQPPAQTPENLVVLDHWVRRGGRLLLFADPMLEWPSKLPLGDVTRPAPMFMDTGLLLHWGLRLDTPERRGPTERQLGGRTVLTVSPGTLHGSCKVSPDQLVARCSIGRGEAAIVADADLLNLESAGGRQNAAGWLAELASLEQP